MSNIEVKSTRERNKSTIRNISKASDQDSKKNDDKVRLQRDEKDLVVKIMRSALIKLDSKEMRRN